MCEVSQEGCGRHGEEPATFGAQCTGDHLIRQRGLDSEEDAEFEGASSSLMLCDRGTYWLDCYPDATRSLDNTVEAFKQWAGPQEKVQSFHCDSAHELISAARERGRRCATATTGVPQTNGLAERMARKKQRGRTLQYRPIWAVRQMVATGNRSILFSPHH